MPQYTFAKKITMPHMLIIDSRDKPVSSPSNNSFRLTLNPAIENVKSARLKFINIPADSAPESYWLLLIQEFGIHVRSADINRTQGTFVVPLLAPGGSRTLFAENSSFTQIAGGQGVSLSTLNIQLLTRNGQAADVGDWSAVIELE